MRRPPCASARVLHLSYPSLEKWGSLTVKRYIKHGGLRYGLSMKLGSGGDLLLTIGGVAISPEWI